MEPCGASSYFLKEFLTVEHGRHFQGTPMEGQLSKFTNLVKGWQYRWFVLYPETGTLSYFLDKDKVKLGPRGSVPLAGAVIAPSDEDSTSFTVNASNGEVYKLRATNAKERQHWINMIRAVSEFHGGNAGQPPSQSNITRSHSFGEALARTFNINKPQSSLTTTLDEKRHSVIPTYSPVSKRAHEPTKPPPNPVKNELKNVKDALNSVDEYHASVVETLENGPQTTEIGGALEENALLLKATSQAMTNVLHQCYTILQHQVLDIQKSATVTGLPPGATIEWIEPGQPVGDITDKVLHGHVNTDSADVLANGEHRESDQHESTSTEGFRNIRQYEDEEVEEVAESESSEKDENMEKHRSLILHLISQAKLGMDLTRVTLPIFVLERRSLLEMYADFFKRSDLFLRIPYRETPEGRMKAVLEFYLTTFHSGRPTKGAKKPYNPIIGETFHCSFDTPSSLVLPDVNNPLTSTTHMGTNHDKDIERLYFVAEQVSHHPPISAFYAESAKKDICMNAHIWTKSKFYGMSIGVINVGEGIISLPNNDEEYIVTFPNAYCRSILTHPWVELGGRTVIKCAKTGYVAVITFHTKPFYGNSEQVGKITAEIKHLATQNIVCNVTGNWNGVMKFSSPADECEEYTTEATTNVVSKKRVRPIANQNEMESRRLWQNVTSALEKGDLEAASAAKHQLEEAQRTDEKQRQLSSTEWATKMFHKHGDGWLFNSHMLLQQTKSKALFTGTDSGQ